ncbi:MAG: hypothetical protein PWP24_960 [Clostridiales bacterium]|nr:hypothetical protein [Clostridiales bacterium]
MKSRKTIATVIIAACVILACSILGITAFAGADKDTICKGVWINTVDVGGMTREEATQAVSQYMDSMNQKTVLITIDQNQVQAKVSDFKLSFNQEEAVETALAVAKKGNFIKRYKEIKDLEKEPMVISMTQTVADSKIKKYVETTCSPYDIPAENASLTRQNGTFVIKDHKVGRKVDVDKTAEAIKEGILVGLELETVNVQAVVVDDQPKYTSEDMALCKDVIGSFSTTYATSSQSRANNLANGARLINGTLLYPGDEFSTGKTLQPFTIDNGYSIAGAYSNGQVIDSVGGGVCQVATTLYNAALNAELEITQRSNHSMIVGYVKPSMDAAIAGDYKDLKIKNNSDSPIYIEATTVGRTITFTIFGHETRDTKNRTVKYESKVLKVIQPGEDKITEDDTKPESFREVNQAAHVGYKAELWKVVYEDGQEVSRERINYSSYAAEPAYVTVGTMKEEDEEGEEDADQVAEDGTDGKGKEDQKKDNDTKASPSPSPSETDASTDATDDTEQNTEQNKSDTTDEDTTDTQATDGALTN